MLTQRQTDHLFRKAVVEDSESIVNHLLLAMEEIVYEFIGEIDSEKARAFLLHFIGKEDNQYSYQNCWVVEQGSNAVGQKGSVVATVNIYDGEKLAELRKPIIEYIKEHFNRELMVENETEPGEYYIDSLGVSMDQQGKGLGSLVLKFLIEEYVHRHNKTLGLLVDIENPNAKRLYLKMGFMSVGKKILVGKNMEHLQIKLD